MKVKPASPLLAPVMIDPADTGLYRVQTHAPGPSGRLPLEADFLLNALSGDLFGWTQNVGMGWKPDWL